MHVQKRVYHNPPKKAIPKFYYFVKIEGGKLPLFIPAKKPNKIHLKIFDNLNRFFHQKQKSTEKFSADFNSKKYFIFTQANKIVYEQRRIK